MAVAHITAIKPDHDRADWLWPVGGVLLLNDGLADPPCPVAYRAGVRRPADRQHLGQQSSDLAERCQRRIAGCEVGQLRRDSIPAEVEDGRTLRLTVALAGANEQPSDAQRHVAEQRAKPHRIVTLAGQHAAAGHTRATTLVQHRHLCRHDLSLQRGGEPLGLFEPQPKLSKARLVVALDPGHLGLRRHARLQFRNQLHPPHQLRHRPTLVT
jgi:hypothetical protein